LPLSNEDIFNRGNQKYNPVIPTKLCHILVVQDEVKLARFIEIELSYEEYAPALHMMGLQVSAARESAGSNDSGLVTLVCWAWNLPPPAVKWE